MSKGNPTKPKKRADSYTVTEVGTLIEDLRGQFRAVVEGVGPLPNRFSAVEERLSAVEDRLFFVENRLSGVESAVRVALPGLSKRVACLESKIGI